MEYRNLFRLDESLAKSRTSFAVFEIIVVKVTDRTKKAMRKKAMEEGMRGY